MKTIGLHEDRIIYLMDTIEINGTTYVAKELLELPADEKSITEAWQAVDDAIKRRIIHERQKDGLEPKGENWNFREFDL